MVPAYVRDHTGFSLVGSNSALQWLLVVKLHLNELVTEARSPAHFCSPPMLRTDQVRWSMPEEICGPETQALRRLQSGEEFCKLHLCSLPPCSQLRWQLPVSTNCLCTPGCALPAAMRWTDNSEDTGGSDPSTAPASAELDPTSGKTHRSRTVVKFHPPCMHA